MDLGHHLALEWRGGAQAKAPQVAGAESGIDVSPRSRRNEAAST
jgi:hypothetical protein